jgi:hypothetical protein
MSNVVSFIAAAFGPDARFEGRIVEEVQRMEQSGMLKALDVLFVRRTGTGELETQPGIPGRPTLVSSADVDEAASGLEPGHAALMLFVEHTWLDGLEQAISEAGGSVVQEGLLPPEQAQAFRG